MRCSSSGEVYIEERLTCNEQHNKNGSPCVYNYDPYCSDSKVLVQRKSHVERLEHRDSNTYKVWRPSSITRTGKRSPSAIAGTGKRIPPIRHCESEWGTKKVLAPFFPLTILEVSNLNILHGSQLLRRRSSKTGHSKVCSNWQGTRLTGSPSNAFSRCFAFWK